MRLFVKSRARALALTALLLITLAGCRGGCDERFVLDSKSPDEEVIATTYVRDCGLAVESQTHVNLRNRKEKFTPDANGVIKEGEVFTVAGHQRVYAIWKNERSLLIRCDGCGKNQVFKSETAWKSVSISFVEK